jgi:hypothetical protein
MRFATTLTLVIAAIASGLCADALRAEGNGTVFDRAQYEQRALLPDFTAAECLNNPRSLDQSRAIFIGTPPERVWPFIAGLF